jgi:hypothetical protein
LFLAGNWKRFRRERQSVLLHVAARTQFNQWEGSRMEKKAAANHDQKTSFDPLASGSLGGIRLAELPRIADVVLALVEHHAAALLPGWTDEKTLVLAQRTRQFVAARGRQASLAAELVEEKWRFRQASAAALVVRDSAVAGLGLCAREGGADAGALRRVSGQERMPTRVVEWCRRVLPWLSSHMEVTARYLPRGMLGRIEQVGEALTTSQKRLDDLRKAGPRSRRAMLESAYAVVESIRRLRTAARTAFIGDPATLREFDVLPLRNRRKASDAGGAGRPAA